MGQNLWIIAEQPTHKINEYRVRGGQIGAEILKKVLARV